MFIHFNVYTNIKYNILSADDKIKFNNKLTEITDNELENITEILNLNIKYINLFL